MRCFLLAAIIAIFSPLLAYAESPDKEAFITAIGEIRILKEGRRQDENNNHEAEDVGDSLLWHETQTISTINLDRIVSAVVQFWTISGDSPAQLSTETPNIGDQVLADHWQGEELQYSQDAPAEALTAYDRALTLDPDHLNSLLGRAEVLRKLGRHRPALIDLDRAIAIGADWTGYLMRARSREVIGDIAGAIADYKRVLLEYPEHVAARQKLAQLGILP